MTPTKEQQEKVHAYLDQCDRDQWSSMVRWMAKQVVSDDPTFAVSIVLREAERRAEKANKYVNEPEKRRRIEEFVSEVFREVGIGITAT